MRNAGLLALAVLFASMIGFAGCAKKEEPPPPPPAEQQAPMTDNESMAPTDNTMEPMAPAEKPMEGGK